MSFQIVSTSSEIPVGLQRECFLIRNDWDDWFSFETNFELIIFDENGKRWVPGYVKIGQVGLKASKVTTPDARTPKLEPRFENLDDRFFSLGQDENYYETINDIGDFGRSILEGLRDCAWDLNIFESHADESVMQNSLLRKLTTANVRNRLSRLANGDADLTEFEFEYRFPITNANLPIPPSLLFHVRPGSHPPTNLHVIIGRNGVGKTRFMQTLATAVLTNNQNQESVTSTIRPLGTDRNNWSFAGLVLVSFSAFDDFDLPESVQQGVHSTLIGLRYNPALGSSVQIKTPKQLADDFCESFERCRFGRRRDRWESAVEVLMSDPLFTEAEMSNLLDLPEGEWRDAAHRRFSRLSSGHAIVLLTITRLVENVDERTLVLLDEPESHLHPPLLAAFIRAVEELLLQRNGIAIVTTHSPVVLQEVPRLCVWKLHRSGEIITVERPQIETFGENLGILTSEIFKYEVTDAGFHKMIRNAVNEYGSYENVLIHFNQQLGLEARAIVQSLVADSD